MEQTQENIHKLYGSFGSGFFNKYGGSFFLSILVLITVVVFIIYINMKVNIVKIKENWNDLKCDPRYAPFAGMVVPEEGKSFFESGTENVQQCFNTVLREVSDQSLSPLYFVINDLKKVANETTDFINTSRKVSSNVRNSLKSIFSDVFSRLVNVMVPFQSMVINLKDIFSKMKASMITSMYPLLGMYYVLKSSIDLMYKVIVKILIGLAATIVVLWIFPFTWGAAAAMTSIFLMIMTPMLIMAVIMGDVFHLAPKKLPRKPRKRHHCFNGDFKIMTQRGEVPINRLLPNDIINGNTRVTSVMKLARNDETLYDLGNGLYVSGTHKIYNPYYKDFIYVANDGRFEKAIERNDQYLYCFNTSNKIIQMNGHLFLDYDELSNEDLSNLITHFRKTFPDLDFNKSSIYKAYDGGLSARTPILMNDAKVKRLCDVKIGDRLWGDIEVQGIVMVSNSIGTFTIQVNDLPIKGCNGNLIFENSKTREKDSTIKYLKFPYDNSTLIKEDYNLHLLTDSGFFYMKNIKLYDYNACLEHFIGEPSCYEKSYV